MTRIIPFFDERKNILARLGRGAEAGTVKQFASGGGEKGLAPGIVVAITDRAHGRADPGFPTAVTEGDGGILAALIEVMDDVLGTALRDGHLQGAQDEFRSHIGVHGPADNTAAPGVDHDGKEHRGG